MLDHNAEHPQDEQMETFEPDLYTLVDENGNEKVFELIDVIQEDDKAYFALVPHIEDPEELLEELELVVLAVSEDEEGNEVLSPVESDEEYERIANIFLARLDEACDCEDDDCDCGCENDDCDCEEHDLVCGCDNFHED